MTARGDQETDNIDEPEEGGRFRCAVCDRPVFWRSDTAPSWRHWDAEAEEDHKAWVRA